MRDVVDLATPDPAIARFRLVKGAERGAFWQVGQYIDGVFISLDVPTVRYIPIDPLPGGPPFGRSPYNPALFICLFILTTIHDMRRVIAQAGYSHIAFKLLTEAIRLSIPPDYQDDPAKVKEQTDRTIADLQKYFRDLQPDDAFIYTDAIEIDRPPGAVSADVQGASLLLETLRKMAAGALKAMPITMGITDGVSEANANRQWELAVAGVRAVQHSVENMLGYFLTMACRARGVQARVEWRFHELRNSEKLRDAQAQKQQDENLMFEFLAGWRGHAEAAQQSVGHSPVEDQPILVPKMYVPINGQAGADQATAADDALDTTPTDDNADATKSTTKGAENGVYA